MSRHVVGLLPLKLAALASTVLAAVACVPGPTPSLTASPSATPSEQPSPSATAYALAPPKDVQAWLASTLHLTFRPLSAAELASVRVSVADAEHIALDERGSGYGPDGSFMTWTKVGCVYLGYYIGPMMPSLGYVPPRLVAYIVQQLGTPVPGWPGMNAQVLVVDAVTAQKSTRYSMGPGIVLGTTCGVTP